MAQVLIRINAINATIFTDNFRKDKNHFQRKIKKSPSSPPNTAFEFIRSLLHKNFFFLIPFYKIQKQRDFKTALL